MFCSNCGVKATGNFCHACGGKLSGGGVALAERPTAAPVASVSIGPWEEEVHYEALIKVPHVRKTLAEISNEAQPGISAGDFLSLCDSAFKPMGPISMTKVAPMLQTMYGNWGIKTGKQRTEFIARPVGVVMFKVLCSLAQSCQKIKEVSQGDDGCIIQAIIPSSVWTMEGKLMVTVTRTPQGTQLEAVTKISGQYYDWGVSNKVLDKLFQSVKMS